MTITTELPRIGSVWRPADLPGRPATPGAVVVTGYTDNGASVVMRAIIDGALLPAERAVTVPIDNSGQPAGFVFHNQQPTLRCVDEAAAGTAVAHLHANGSSASVAVGMYVLVAVTPPGVLRFAEEAFDNGWAHDEDCARLIGDLG